MIDSNKTTISENLSVTTGSNISLDYTAIENKGRRKSTKTKVKSEGQILKVRDRDTLNATTQDLQRNNAILAWSVRKHLDYVSIFTFQSKTKDRDLNKLIEKAWKEWSKKENCDKARRHNLDRIIRLFEACKVIGGDAALLKLKGFKLQGIEADRITKPKDWGIRKKDKKWQKTVSEDGLIKDIYSAVIKYVICGRAKNGGYVYQSAAKAEDVVFDGYFMRFDQTRGVSPLTSAINTYLDIEECNEAQLIKSKIQAMMGFAIGSDQEGSSGFGEKDSETGDDPTVDSEKYDFDIELGFKLELDKGDRVDLLESKTPSIEYQQFIMLMVRIALFALDIPYSFFDSKGSSYSARKQDSTDYELSALSKRVRNQEALEDIAAWRLPSLLDTDKIRAKMEALSLSVDDLEYEFVPQATPWVDELREVQAAAYRIAIGVSSRTRECKRHGVDFMDIVDELMMEEGLIAETGITISSGLQPGQEPIIENNEPEEKEEVNNAETE